MKTKPCTQIEGVHEGHSHTRYDLVGGAAIEYFCLGIKQEDQRYVALQRLHKLAGVPFKFSTARSLNTIIDLLEKQEVASKKDRRGLTKKITKLQAQVKGWKRVTDTMAENDLHLQRENASLREQLRDIQAQLEATQNKLGES